MKILKQQTYETCLPCCLLMMTGQGNKDEIEIWKHGWRFNYLIGQLNYVASNYDKQIEVYVENTYYFKELKKQKNKAVELVNEKINVALISKFLEKDRIILYLDNYYLQGVVHAPHFVVATKKVGDQIEIADPYDGKLKSVSIKVIIQAITSLRNHLKYSPVLIKFLRLQKK